YVEHAPELVVEVAASSVSLDLGPKRHAYAAAGVREYIVWRTLDDAIDWFTLRDGAFVPLNPDADELLKSQVFRGLWLDAAAALRRDTAEVLTALQRGLSSPEHARFVADLQTRRTS